MKLKNKGTQENPRKPLFLQGFIYFIFLCIFLIICRYKSLQKYCPKPHR